MHFSRDTVKKILEEIPKVESSTIALRSVMRVLPILALRENKGENAKNAFCFFPKEERIITLTASYRAILKSFNSIYHQEVFTKDSPNLYFSSIKNFSLHKVGHEHRIESALEFFDHASLFDFIKKPDLLNTASGWVIAALAVIDASGDIEDIPNNPYDYACIAYSKAYPLFDDFNEEIIKDIDRLKNFSAANLLSEPLWNRPVLRQWLLLLDDFKADAISLDAGFEVWLDWYDDRIQGKPIDWELFRQWNDVAAEIQAQGPSKYNAYLKSLVHKTVTQPLNRVRAIFIGYGEAGKTSLVRVLRGETVVEGKEDMTAGIDISDWPLPNSDIVAHFWDFGGQVMAHATHQFFLRERCLYILVLNARNEINSNEQAEYWLEHVKAFGNRAPVMIVGNKFDQAAVNLDMNYLQQKYPHIIGFYPLSCTQAQGAFKAKFDSFKHDFCQHLMNIGTHQVLFTSEQFEVLEALRACATNRAFLPHSEFDSLCESRGIGHEGEFNRDWLLDLLDKLGVVVHFPQISFLDDFVLNPRWLTQGVYALMFHRQPRLSEKDVTRILQGKEIKDENGNVLDYPKDKCRFLLEAMQQFKLAYPISTGKSIFGFGQNRNDIVIPELLPSNRPISIPFQHSGALAFEFKFTGFLPRHVMPELIVTRNDEIVDNIVWQNGVLLENKTLNARALLEVSYHDRIIQLWVDGRDAKDYLTVLNDTLLTILGRLTDLNYEEYVHLPLSACKNQDVVNVTEKAEYRALLNSVRRGIYDWPGKYNVYDLRKVMNLVLPDSEISKLNVMIGSIIQGDNVGVKTVQKQTVNVGRDLTNSNLIVAENIRDSFNSLKNSLANNDVKVLLQNLLREIEELNAKVPASSVVKELSDETQALINESTRETPRKRWYETSLEGIKEAALSLKEIGEPVLDIVEKLSPLLLS
jgi:hypothetical protein